jgi:hypothetical protein
VGFYFYLSSLLNSIGHLEFLDILAKSMHGNISQLYLSLSSTNQ